MACPRPSRHGREVRTTPPSDACPPHGRAWRPGRGLKTSTRPKGRRSPMTPLGKSKHVAARMGRWSASHWKTATFGWLAFVVAAFAIGNVLGTKTLDPNKAGSGESGHVQSVLADEFKQPASESVIVKSTSSTVDAPEFRRAVASVISTLQSQQHVRAISSPFVPANAGQISADRHAALVQFKME